MNQQISETNEVHRTAEVTRTSVERPNYRNEQPRPSRWIWAVVAILAVIGIGIVIARTVTRGQSAATKGRGGPSAPVVTSVAHKGDIGVYLTGLGTVTPIYTVTVKTRVDGQLMSVFYKEGQTIHKGDPLVEIDPRPFQVQLSQAEGQLIKDQAALRNAQTDLQRYQTLLARNAVAQQIVATQEATVAQDEGVVKTDQANIDSAKLNITYSHLTAPITGRVGLRLVDPGNLVSASSATPLAVITQVQPISVIFTIPEQEVGSVFEKIRAGQHLTVDALDRDMKTVLATGELTTADNQMDPTTGTLRLRATFPNTKETLFPNQFVNARLLVEQKRGVTLVTNAAIQRSTSSTFVYVVKPDHTVAVQNVTLGATNADESEVVSGLAPGDVVVTQGVDRLQEGSKVQTATDGQGSGTPGASQGENGGRRNHSHSAQGDSNDNASGSSRHRRGDGESHSQ